MVTEKSSSFSSSPVRIKRHRSKKREPSSYIVEQNNDLVHEKSKFTDILIHKKYEKLSRELIKIKYQQRTYFYVSFLLFLFIILILAVIYFK